MQVMPNGVEGLVGMVRNWTFTLFFCMSELWGDVVLGLLFWGLANDTTTLADAPTLYPLFGLGANIAQALAGSVLKLFCGVGHDVSAFGTEIQSLMVVVLGFSVATLALHTYIHSRHVAARRAAAAAAVAAAAQKRVAAGLNMQQQDPAARSGFSTQASSSGSASGVSSTGGSTASAGSIDVVGPGEAGQVEGGADGQDAEQPLRRKRIGRKKSKGPKPSVMDIFRVLAASVPIRCLAVMSLAQVNVCAYM